MDRLSNENEVQRMDVYQTVKPLTADEKIMQAIQHQYYDLILFTSPSTFENFCSFYGTENIKELKSASIGSTTTKAMKDSGLEPLITAKKSTAEGLSEAIIEYFKN
jgi:uroporphyrinogen-III synthase